MQKVDRVQYVDDDRLSAEAKPHLLIQGCALLDPQRQSGLLFDQDILIVGEQIKAVGPGGTLTRCG